MKKKYLLLFFLLYLQSIRNIILCRYLLRTKDNYL